MYKINYFSDHKMLWWLSSIKLRILNGSQEGNRWLSSEIIFSNPKFEVLCQFIAYLHIPADLIFHPDTATDGVKKQKLLLMLQECDEQEAAEILPAIEYLLALIHKRGNSNE